MKVSYFKKLTILLSILIMIVGIFALISCREKTSSQKVVIAQWGHEKYFIYLPVYVAMEKGFFEEEGIEVSLKYSGNDDQVFAAVLQGSAHFGIGDPVFTAISNEKGGDLGRVVAVIVNGVAIWGVTNKEDIDVIENPVNLKGLRIGTFPAPSTNYSLMKKTILSGGENFADTKIVEAPIGGQIGLLERNLADIAMVLEPAASIAEVEGYRIVFSSPQFYGPFVFTGLTTSTEFINVNPDIVQGVVNAVQKALVFCHENVDETIKIANEILPSLSHDVVRKAVNRMIREETLPKNAIIEERAWNAALKIRIEIGDLEKMQPLNMSVDNAYAVKAIKE